MSVKINKFAGWIPAFSRYLLPVGGAVEQTNITTLTPGQLTVRGGSKKIVSTDQRMVELWGLSVGSGKTDVVLGQGESGNIVEFTGIGGSPASTTKYSGRPGNHPVTFSQGRRGEVYIYQGYGQRGLVRDVTGAVRPVGLEAPTAKPSIAIDTRPSYYVARIDITDVGNGYHLPPTVSIAAPTGSGGKQATALARIASAQVSAIDVTNGGSGYEKVPCVTLTDTPNGPATGTGAEAAVQLEDGAAGGDPETGIVYWEISQLPTWFWLCLGEYQREGNGYIVPVDSGGSGSGAKAIFWFDGIYEGNCYKQNSDGTELKNFGVRVQVYDFGSGYQPGDVVTATLHVAGSFTAGVTSGPNCNTNQECQVKAQGVTQYSPIAPDKQTIINANTYKQKKIKTEVKNGGSGYLTPPTFTTEDGDIINTEVDCDGAVTKLILSEPNKTYLFAPTLVKPNGDVGGARALAIVRPNMRGKYQCYYRYVNENVPKEQGGPILSSLSPVNEVDCGDSAKALTWSGFLPQPGATHVELWRSTANQATTLFRVTKLPVSATSYLDTLTDEELSSEVNRADYDAESILLADGSLNLNRFGIASTDFAVGVVFQDRLFLSVDTTGTRPSTILFSEADEPESLPETNELILQNSVRDSDYITALIPYAGALMVMQSKHCYRLNFIARPEIDATVSLVAYRGCLNQRCWDLWMGVAYLIDENGLYTLDPQGSVEGISGAIDSLFRANTDPLQPTIDFSKREWFIVRADRNQGVIRFHVSFTGDEGKYPTRQIVYDPDSKTFWLEQYPYIFSAASEVRTDAGQLVLITASERGLHTFSTGLTDDGEPISYSLRSGNFTFDTDATVKNGGQQGPRNVSVVFRPTDASCLLKLASYYNGSNIPRGHVARRDRGVGFVHDDGEPAAYVDMARMPHQEAESHGIARALFAGKTIEAVYGGDTHVSLQLYGEQTSAGPIVIHTVNLEGVSSNGSE